VVGENSTAAGLGSSVERMPPTTVSPIVATARMSTVTQKNREAKLLFFL